MDSLSRQTTHLFMVFSIVVMAISSWISFRVGLVPYTMQNFGILLTSLILSPNRAFISIGLYLLLIGMGIPIASGFRGGIHILFGYTSGYLWGFLISAPIVSWVSRLYLRMAGRKMYEINRRDIAILLLIVSIAMAPTYILGSIVLYLYMFKIPQLYSWAKTISLSVGISTTSPMLITFIAGVAIFLPQDILMDHFLAILAAREVYRYLYEKGLVID